MALSPSIRVIEKKTTWRLKTAKLSLKYSCWWLFSNRVVII